MRAPLVWLVLWVDAAGRGLGDCGHRHATDTEATLCPWEPAAAPVVSAGLVRQVRDPAYAPAHLSDSAYLARRAARDALRAAVSAQLELDLEAG